MNIFWKSTTESSVFPLFSVGHITALAIIIAIIISMFVFSKKLKSESVKKWAGYIIGIFMFLQQFLLYLWYQTSGNFTVQESLPLYACRITSILCIIMMMNKKYSVYEVVYFWGLGGAIPALITPDTGGFLFPHIMYIQFFVGHGGILIAMFFMMIAYEYKPTIKSLIKSIKCLFAYFICVDVFNFIFQANYSYLRAKPNTHSFFDYLPQYPYYVPIIFVIYVAIFTVLYLPYHIKNLKFKNNRVETRTIA